MYPTLLGLRLVTDITAGRPQPLGMAALLRSIRQDPRLLVWSKPVAAVGTTALSLALLQGQQQLMAAGRLQCKDPQSGPGLVGAGQPVLHQCQELMTAVGAQLPRHWQLGWRAVQADLVGRSAAALAAQPDGHAAAAGGLDLPQGPGLLRFTKVLPVVLRAHIALFHRGTPILRALLLPVAANSTVQLLLGGRQGLSGLWQGVEASQQLAVARHSAVPSVAQLSAAAGWAAGPEWSVAGCGGQSAAGSEAAQCCAQCGTASEELLKHWDWQSGSSSSSGGSSGPSVKGSQGVRPLLLQLPWPISSGANEPDGMPLGCYSGGQGLESVQLRRKSGQVWLKLRKAE
ncbi:hypothetical protein HaLaN_18179, partial [Haematococcus lacustris]